MAGGRRRAAAGEAPGGRAGVQESVRRRGRAPSAASQARAAERRCGAGRGPGGGTGRADLWSGAGHWHPPGQNLWHGALETSLCSTSAAGDWVPSCAAVSRGCSLELPAGGHKQKEVSSACKEHFWFCRVRTTSSAPRNPELHERGSWIKLPFSCLVSSHCSVCGPKPSCLLFFHALKTELFHLQPCLQCRRETKRVRLIPPHCNLFHLSAE